jgi:hypothetical protein
VILGLMAVETTRVILRPARSSNDLSSRLPLVELVVRDSGPPE